MHAHAQINKTTYRHWVPVCKRVGVVYFEWHAHGLTCMLPFSQLPRGTGLTHPCATRKQRHQNPTINVLTWLHPFRVVLFQILCTFRGLPYFTSFSPHFKSTSSSYTHSSLFSSLTLSLSVFFLPFLNL